MLYQDINNLSGRKYPYFADPVSVVVVDDSTCYNDWNWLQVEIQIGFHAGVRAWLPNSDDYEIVSSYRDSLVQEDLIGRWRSKIISDAAVRYDFYADGSFANYVDGRNPNVKVTLGTFSLQDPNILSLSLQDRETTTWRVSFENDLLILERLDGDATSYIVLMYDGPVDSILFQATYEAVNPPTPTLTPTPDFVAIQSLSQGCPLEIALLNWEDERANLYIVNGDGSQMTNLATFNFNTSDDILYASTILRLITQLEWSPDGSEVLLPTLNVANETGGLIAVSTSTGNQRPLFDFVTNQTVAILPRWAPNGQYIAFVGLSILQPESTNLYIIDLAGNVAHSTSFSGEFSSLILEWSPDSSKLLIISGDEPANLQIYHIAENFTETIASADNGIGNAHWSPDGRQIAYTEAQSPINDSTRLILINTDGSNRVDLQAGFTWYGEFAWSQDGIQLVFEGGDNALGDTGIYAININDIAVRTIAERSGRAFIKFSDISEKGDLIIFNRGFREMEIASLDGSVHYVFEDFPFYTHSKWRPCSQAQTTLEIPIATETPISQQTTTLQPDIGYKSGQTVLLYNEDVLEIWVRDIPSSDTPNWTVVPPAVVARVLPSTPIYDSGRDWTWYEIEVIPSGIRGWVEDEHMAELRPSGINQYGIDCADAVGYKIDLGQRFIIPYGDGSTMVFREPNAGSTLGQINEGEGGTIVDGPVCVAGQQGYMYSWYVRTDTGLEGWVSEGYPDSPLPWIAPIRSAIVLSAVNQELETFPVGVPSIECSGSLPPRLRLGAQARVTPGLPNNLRANPESDEILGQIPGGEEFRVLDGPLCGETKGNTWWRVEYNGIVGWTAESDETEYWTELIEVSSTPVSIITTSSTNYSIIYFNNNEIRNFDLASGTSTTLHVLNEEQYSQLELDQECPQFSANERYLAIGHLHDFSLSGSTITILNVQTGQVVFNYDNVTKWFDWSPNDSIIAYGIYDYSSDGSTSEEPGIWILNVETSERRLLAIPQIGEILVQPNWSPDGSYIVFREGTRATAVGGLFTIMESETPTNRIRWLPQYFDWPPDGFRIVFEDGGVIYTANYDGSDRQWLIGNPQDRFTDPKWSPDSRFIAFNSAGISLYDGSLYPQNLWLLDTTTGSTYQLTDYEVGDKVWSPDSTQLVLSTDGSLQVLPLDGSSPINIGEGHCASWHNSPKAMVFESEPDFPDDTPALTPLSQIAVYTEPSITSEEIGSVWTGNIYKVIGKNSNSLWAEIEFDNQFGWVCRENTIDNGLIFTIPVTQSLVEDCHGNITDVPQVVSTLDCRPGWTPSQGDQASGLTWITITEFEELHNYYRDTEKAALTQVASTVWYDEMYQEVRLELTLKFFEQFLARTARTVGGGIGLVLAAKDYAFPSVHDARLTYIASRDLRLQLELYNYPPYKCGEFVQVPIGLVDGGLLPNISNPFTSLSKYLPWDALLLCAADRTTCNELFGSGE